MKSIKIYTDGSCDPNPGPGGWAAVIIAKGEEKIISGSSASSTNNRMELTAAIEAIKLQKPGDSIMLYTDSLYVKKGITEWMENWIARNWKRKGGKLANVDLWKDLASEIGKYKITWKWVRGHAGNHYNEMVDTEARRQTNQIKKKR